MTKSLANKMCLKEWLYTICKVEGISIYKSHLDEFYSILLDLKNFYIDVDYYEDRVVLLLVPLLKSYTYFKEIMLYGNSDTQLVKLRKNFNSKLILRAKVKV